ncbi:unnamed protein product [Camellia sinensis]
MSPRSVHAEGEEQGCLSLVDPRKIFSELAFSKLVCSRTVVQPGGPTCCSTHFGVVLSIRKAHHVARPTFEWCSYVGPNSYDCLASEQVLALGLRSDLAPPWSEYRIGPSTKT